MLRWLPCPAPPPSTLRPALFVDRDGVLNEQVTGGYVTEPVLLSPSDEYLQPLRAAMAEGIPIVIVTNQGMVSRRLATESDVAEIHAVLLRWLASHGISIAGIYVCPHHPAASVAVDRVCPCRKPAPGLLLAAAADLGIDLAASRLIGDQPSDRAAGLAAGIPDHGIRIVASVRSAPVG